MPNDIGDLLEQLDGMGLTPQVFGKIGIPHHPNDDDAHKYQVVIHDFRLRTTLYFNQIVWMQQQLNGYVNGLAPQNQNRVRLALSSVDQTGAWSRESTQRYLLAQFCLIMDEFATAALSYRFDCTKKVDPYQPNPEPRNKPVVDLNDFLNKTFYLGDYNNNISKFYNLYRTTGHAVGTNPVMQNGRWKNVGTLTRNFFNNITQASDRILGDWNIIEAAFEVPLAQLLRIASTGSDFHKGGKQVLILTFRRLIPSEKQVPARFQLIYKPSDVEIDRRIIGVQYNRNRVPIGPNLGPSLMEIINRLIPADWPRLPTYRIFPRVFGSENPAPGIRETYGYIEFLGDPPLADNTVGQAPNYLTGAGNFRFYSESKNDRAKFTHTFYRIAGYLLAIASTFSIQDLHAENVIAFQFAPYLIDLEVSLTQKIRELHQTELIEQINTIISARFTGHTGETGFMGSASPIRYWHKEDSEKRITYRLSDLMSPNVKNRLKGPEANQTVAINSEAFQRGLKEMLELLGNNPQLFEPWFNGINNSVVRYLPAGTSDFRKVLERIYILNPAWDALANIRYHTALNYRNMARNYTIQQQGPVPQDPNFAAWNPNYTVDDYLNADIPVYYRRIDQQNIVNSLGNPVAINNGPYQAPQDFQIPKIGNGTTPPPPNTVPIGTIPIEPAQVTPNQEQFFQAPPTTNNVRPQLNTLAPIGIEHFTRADLLHRELQISLRTFKVKGPPAKKRGQNQNLLVQAPVQPQPSEAKQTSGCQAPELGLSVVQQISCIILCESDWSGNTLTLEQSSFEGISVMQTFFTQVIGADKFVIENAMYYPQEMSQEETCQQKKFADWLSITGTSTLSFASTKSLDILLSIFGPDEDVIVRLQGDYPPDISYQLPVVDWLGINHQRVAVRISGRFSSVRTQYEGTAYNASQGGVDIPGLRLIFQPVSQGRWRMDARKLLNNDGLTPKKMGEISKYIVDEVNDQNVDESEIADKLDNWDYAEPGTPIDFNKEELEALLNTSELTSFIPSTLASILETVGFSRLGAEIVLQQIDKEKPHGNDDGKELEFESLPYYSVSVSTPNDQTWKVLPDKIMIEDMGLILTQYQIPSISRDDGDTNIEQSSLYSGQVTGTFVLGSGPNKVYLPVYIEHTMGGLWGIGLQPEQPPENPGGEPLNRVILPSLYDLIELAAGKTFASSLPPSFTTMPKLRIPQLLFTFNPDTSTLERFDFAFCSANDPKSRWEILPGYFEVSFFQAEMSISDLATENSTLQRLSLLGVFDIGSVPIQCSLEINAGQPNWMLSCGLPPDSSVNLTAIARTLLDSYVQIPTNLPDFIFTELNITVYVPVSGGPEPQKGQDYQLRCTAGSMTPWVLSPNFSITNFHLEFFYNTNRELPVAGTFKGSFAIGSIDLSIEADINNTPDGGWRFFGRSEHGEIKIGELGQELAKKFGVPGGVPKSLASLTASDIKVAFQSQTLDFTLSFKTQMDLGSSNADLSVDIEMKRGSDGLYNKKFSGVIDLGGYEFALIFAEENHEDTFLAVYHDGSGQDIDISSLIANFTSVSLPPMTFGVYQASFVYHQGIFLFGFDMEAGVNLSNLPLIGQLLPVKDTVRLDYQVLFTSATVTNTVLSRLNTLMPTTATPYPILKDDIPAETLYLSTKISLGTWYKNVNLSLTINDEGEVVLDSPPHHSSRDDGDHDLSSIRWVQLQRQFGPVHFNKLGMRQHGKDITFLLDANLSLASLDIDVDGLSVTSGLTSASPTFLEPKFDLLGLSFQYQQEEVSVDGAFLRTTITKDGTHYDEYDGVALLSMPNLTIAGLGSYARIKDAPSLFVYAVLDAPLGGAPFFFIEGLAAGFGYNRGFIPPGIDDVSTFPLVEAACDGIGSATAEDVANMLEELQVYIPPRIGTSFFSMGIKFNSFRLLDAFVLANVIIGRSLEIDMLGLATTVIPTPELDSKEVIPPLVVAELALKARFTPAEGFVGIQGQLTPASHIFSHDCLLTGGFAAFAWFSNSEHRGDFVLTLGGYHPDYTPPEHYPLVPRLAFTWRIDSSLIFKGSVYCALTPSLLMAGGRFDASYNNHGLQAWYSANANFLIGWKPYHYEAQMEVRIGGSYTFKAFGIRKKVSVDVGAALQLWGPELSGVMKVYLYAVKITIAFGKGSPKPPDPISWDMFVSSFLPEKSSVVSTSIVSGTLAESQRGQEATVVDPHTLEVEIHSAIPCKTLKLAQKPDALVIGTTETPFGIRPMDIDSTALDSTLTLTIDGPENAKNNFEIEPVYTNMPVSLWGTTYQGTLHEDPTLNQLIVGATLRSNISEQAIGTEEIDLTCLLHGTGKSSNTISITDPIDWTPNLAGQRETVAKTIASPEVAKARTALLAAFGVDSQPINVSAVTAGIVADPLGTVSKESPHVLATPDALVAEAVLDGIRVTWLPVPGAIDYELSLTGITGAAVPEISIQGTLALVTNLVGGTDVTVKVRARAEDNTGPWTAPIQVTVQEGIPQVQGVTLLNTPDSIVARWQKVLGAEQYFAICNHGVSSATKITPDPNVGFLNLPQEGQAYKVTVAAQIDGALGSYSEPQSIIWHQLDTPTITGTSFTTESQEINVSWDAVIGATGYLIELFDESGRPVRPPSPVHVSDSSASLSAAHLPVGAIYQVSVSATGGQTVSNAAFAQVEIS